jgi:hypothetical protein
MSRLRSSAIPSGSWLTKWLFGLPPRAPAAAGAAPPQDLDGAHIRNPGSG